MFEKRQKLPKATGTAQLTIPLGALRVTPVQLPPLPHQRRIASKLNSLFARTKSARHELDRLPLLIEHYKQAILEKAFTGELTADWRLEQGKPSQWDKTFVGDMLRGIKAGKNLRCEERSPQPNERGVVKVSAVTWGFFDTSQAKTFPKSFQPDPDTLIKDRDFLFSRANTIDLVGVCVIVEKAPPNLYLSDKVLRLDLSDDDKEWLLWFFRSPVGRSRLENASTGNQLSMRNISQAALRNIEIPFPPPEERYEIVRRIEAAMDWLNIVGTEQGKAIHLLERLDRGLLAKAFRGELVPQDPNDEPVGKLLERIRPVQAEGAKSGRNRRVAV
jgi:type I restriction enzyme S subunit